MVLSILSVPDSRNANTCFEKHIQVSIKLTKSCVSTSRATSVESEGKIRKNFPEFFTMKIRRYKKAFKNLNFYVNNFGFHKPFQILIDGTFCFAALQNRIQIKEDIPKYLGNEIKFLTTQCVILETEKLGHDLIGAMKIVKTFGTHKCGHDKNPRTGSACLLSMVGSTNSNRYIIATQDRDLHSKLQAVPAVPILYINRTSVILKPLSNASVQLADEKKRTTLGLSEHQEQVLNSLNLKTFGSVKTGNDDDSVCMPRKARGPNPLSCKKKIKVTSGQDERQDEQPSASSKKRRRKRTKLPKHVKQELFGAGQDRAKT